MTRKIIVIIFLIIGFSSCNRQVPFNSDIWKSSGGEAITTDRRLNMTDDLLNSNLLINKYKYQIDSLLGSTITTAYSSLPYTDIETKMYLVKEVYSYDIDPDDLIFIKVEFNENHKSFRAVLTSERKIINRK